MGSFCRSLPLLVLWQLRLLLMLLFVPFSSQLAFAFLPLLASRQLQSEADPSFVGFSFLEDSHFSWTRHAPPGDKGAGKWPFDLDGLWECKTRKETNQAICKLATCVPSNPNRISLLC